MFIDMHCHILPGLDDGADTMDEACELISQACSSGSTIAVATPHFNNISQGSVHCNKDRIVEMYKTLRDEVQKRNIPITLFLGSEILLDDSIDYLYKHDKLITVNGSRYILVEFNFNEKIENVYLYIDKLLSFGLIPVIAHPERYLFYHDPIHDIYRMINSGCKIQINKDSPLGNYGTKAQNLSINLLENDFVHMIASDCHNVNQRNADMGVIYSWLLERFKVEKITQLLHDNPKRILLDSEF